ncbi:phosphatidylserine decarboxylase family protein [Ceratobasidium sp. AG-Ba]|nr:phosphatidylserine decarboxylase family protein [Ceratobasidium sp. AG-Ba]
MSSGKQVNYRVGGWLPNDHPVMQRWLGRLVKRIEHEKISEENFHPVIKEFQAVIENNPDIYVGFQLMFDEVPKKPPYNQDPSHHRQIRSYQHMLQAFNIIIQSAPEYESNDGLVGFPINAILDWPMATPAGLVTFLIPKLNEMFKKMFAVWSEFLTSPASCSVLNTSANGWFGPAASADIPNFASTFICDPEAPHYGFKSWDNFFTRQFREGLRPVEFPDNDSIINSACECAFYRLKHNVHLHSDFVLKGQPYSLTTMLNHDELTQQFVGGTVYQAFLSAFSYHRFVSPVNGKVVKVVAIPGSYYAESPQEGFSNPDGPDPAAANLSQAYITSVAARTVLYIQADNPAIGLMAFMAVGMAEVSTCEIVVKPNQRIKKGDETGMFHFGGSTHCLIFRRGVNVTFDSAYTEPGASIKLNSAIATVS